MGIILINLLLGVIGLFGLYFGGEKLVTGSVTIASTLKLRPQLIAVTIIALGTSLPELVVSVNAVLKDSPDIAFGNVVGSNISNLLCVLGLAAIAAPLYIQRGTLKIDVFWLLLASSIFATSAQFLSSISLWGGFLLILLLLLVITHLAYVSLDTHNGKIANKIGYDVEIKGKLLYGLMTVFFGALILLGSAELVVFSAKKIAAFLFIPEVFIGLTIIAMGTSLPEIAASVVAVKKGYSDIAIGNVVGSNIFNSLGIIGASAIASGSNKFVAPENFLKFDIMAMLCITIIIGGILLYARKVGGYLGIIFLCTYLAYILISFQQM